MFNRIQLVGNLADDAIIRVTQSGVRYATFRVITSDEVYSSETGSWGAQTTAFDVVIWGHLAKYAEKAARKGNLFLVEGKMKEHRYEKDGQTRYSWQVVVNDRLGAIRALSRPAEDARRDPYGSDRATDQTIDGELVEQFD